MERRGRCLCGAVSYTATVPKLELAACHCGMCRRWTAGPFLAVGAADVAWEGEEKIGLFQSSEWAERGFCSACGSSLFYRVTAPGPHQGAVQLAFGTLDEQSGFDLHLEWFIDKKPDSSGLEGERKTLTEAEVFAMFGGD